MRPVFRAVAAALLTIASLHAPAPAAAAGRNESGGPILPEQAAYDVLYYDLALRVDPAARSISGVCSVRAKFLRPADWFVLDLDEVLAVESVGLAPTAGAPGSGPLERPLAFERRGGRIWAKAPAAWRRGDIVEVRVAYGGTPRVGPKPPWDDGFVWSTTPGGAPWVGVACQDAGGDLWWPCKDHPSDEPDGMTLHITAPAALDCAANGRLEGVRANADGTRTFDWRVSTPINNYAVSLVLAPFERVEAAYTSVTGETVPMIFWALPEHAAQARTLLGEFRRDVRFLEETFGPYPFRADKIGIAEAPYLGMEHQTVIAYGAKFANNAEGFDELLFHEFAHEWWANLVTAADWNGYWIHEGFATYAGALYAEKLAGPAALRARMAAARKGIRNLQPIAPRESRTASQVYKLAPDFVESDGDIYGKGALVLDTLRFLVGDPAFFRMLRRMAYEDPALETVKDGRQCRLVTTEDIIRIAERESGMKLGWFFDTYLRQAKLPRLVTETTAKGMRLRWESPAGVAFPMPVEVEVDGARRRVAMPGGVAEVTGSKIVVDPDGRVLMDAR